MPKKPSRERAPPRLLRLPADLLCRIFDLAKPDDDAATGAIAPSQMALVCRQLKAAADERRRATRRPVLLLPLTVPASAKVGGPTVLPSAITGQQWTHCLQTLAALGAERDRQSANLPKAARPKDWAIHIVCHRPPPASATTKTHISTNARGELNVRHTSALWALMRALPIMAKLRLAERVRFVGLHYEMPLLSFPTTGSLLLPGSESKGYFTGAYQQQVEALIVSSLPNLRIVCIRAATACTQADVDALKQLMAKDQKEKALALIAATVAAQNRLYRATWCPVANALVRRHIPIDELRILSDPALDEDAATRAALADPQIATLLAPTPDLQAGLFLHPASLTRSLQDYIGAFVVAATKAVNGYATVFRRLKTGASILGVYSFPMDQPVEFRGYTGVRIRRVVIRSPTQTVVWRMLPTLGIERLHLTSPVSTLPTSDDLQEVPVPQGRPPMTLVVPRMPTHALNYELMSTLARLMPWVTLEQ